MNKLSKTLALSLATLTLAGSSTPIFAARASKKVDNVTIPRHRAAATETNGRTGEAVSTPRDRGARPERVNAIPDPLRAIRLLDLLNVNINIILGDTPRATEVKKYKYVETAQFVIDNLKYNDDTAYILCKARDIINGYTMNKGRTGEAVSTPRNRGARPERINAIPDPLRARRLLNLLNVNINIILRDAPRATEVKEYNKYVEAAQFVIDNLKYNDDTAYILCKARDIINGYTMNSSMNEK